MKDVLFSVIIPTLNEEQFLPKLLESLVKQSKKNFEVIVVDGSSKDRTVSLAKAMIKRLPMLTVVVSDKANLSLQRNLGAKKSRGEWLVFVDADSILLPYFFDRIQQFIQDYTPDVFTTWFRPDSETHGDVIITLVCNLFLEAGLMLHRPMAPGSLTIVRRSVFDAVGGYNQTVRWGEDYDFSKRVADRGFQLKILRETLSVWSLRRMRKQGKIATLSTYAKASILVLLTKKTFKHVPGYVMGGDVYNEKKKKQQ
jgi:glycosyltransferase involved in cell wall biosynthesis